MHFFLYILIGSIINIFIFYIIKLIAKNKYKALIENFDWEERILEEIDPHLERLLYALKKQVPVVGMFFTESLRDKFKVTTKEEVSHALPRVKDQLEKGIKAKVIPFLFPLYYGSAFFSGAALGTIFYLILKFKMI